MKTKTTTTEKTAAQKTMTANAVANAVAAIKSTKSKSKSKSKKVDAAPVDVAPVDDKCDKATDCPTPDVDCEVKPAREYVHCAPLGQRRCVEVCAVKCTGVHGVVGHSKKCDVFKRLVAEGKATPIKRAATTDSPKTSKTKTARKAKGERKGSKWSTQFEIVKTELAAVCAKFERMITPAELHNSSDAVKFDETMNGQTTDKHVSYLLRMMGRAKAIPCAKVEGSKMVNCYGPGRAATLADVVVPQTAPDAKATTKSKSKTKTKSTKKDAATSKPAVVKTAPKTKTKSTKKATAPKSKLPAFRMVTDEDGNEFMRSTICGDTDAELAAAVEKGNAAAAQ